jgi:MFS family permease
LVDAAARGLVTTGFVSYYLTTRYHVPVGRLGWLFFAVSVVQAVSVALAPALARRFGLVATMVGTHLPSNVLLAAVAFAPSFWVAAALLLARTTLSQMDVPTRQALVMTVVTPEERTGAAAVTNAARYTVRPVGPLVAGIVQQVALGAPVVLAGMVKAGYDLALWRWARRAGLAPGSAIRGRHQGSSAEDGLAAVGGLANDRDAARLGPASETCKVSPTRRLAVRGSWQGGQSGTDIPPTDPYNPPRRTQRGPLLRHQR